MGEEGEKGINLEGMIPNKIVLEQMMMNNSQFDLKLQQTLHI